MTVHAEEVVHTIIYEWRIQDFPKEGVPTVKVGVPTY